MESNFKKFRRTNIAEMKPYTPDMDMSEVSIAKEDAKAGSPKVGDMIARNPENHKDQWLVSEKYASDNFEPMQSAIANKELSNTSIEDAKKKVSDIEVFGDGDTFELICKASSKSQGWMKSTKAMKIKPNGLLVQVSTQQGDNVAEALTYIPGAVIREDNEGNKRIELR